MTIQVVAGNANISSLNFQSVNFSSFSSPEFGVFKAVVNPARVPLVSLRRSMVAHRRLRAFCCEVSCLYPAPSVMFATVTLCIYLPPEPYTMNVRCVTGG